MNYPIDDTFSQKLRALVRTHFYHDPNITAAHWFGPSEQPENEIPIVRLLEVNDQGPCTGKLYVFSFRATPPEVPFKLQVADIHPDDWTAIQAGTLPLPQGWPPKPLQSFFRSDMTDEDERHASP